MINEKVSVRDFKEFETDIRGIGLVGDLLGNLSQTELRYYYEENTELTLSLDNIKTVLTKYAVNTENNRGISIINIRFNPGNYATAILRREGQSLSAIVYATSSSVLLPYLLYYSGGTWTDILLASGRIMVTGEYISDTVANNSWTSIKKISLPSGVWEIDSFTIFAANSNGLRGIRLSINKDVGAGPLTSEMVQAVQLQDGETNISISKVVSSANQTDVYLNAYQNSGSSLITQCALYAYRLS